MPDAIKPFSRVSAALELSGIGKSFAGLVALEDGQLSVEKGSIHAIVGENGAGKSTMVKIIAGNLRPDKGVMSVYGSPVDFASPADSKAVGIAVVYQEPTLYTDLSISENIFIGRLPLGRFGKVDRERMRAECLVIFERLGVTINPDQLAAGLSIADQQVVEIAKALSRDARILVMDEPTAALSSVEVERLFSISRSLRDEGSALVFISHRFDEVFELCDTVTVMRDGKFVSEDPILKVDQSLIVRRMVGRDVSVLFPKASVQIGDVRLKVDSLTSRGLFTEVSFEVRAGEFVCLSGLVGSGRSEVARAIFGIDAYDSGEVSVDGAKLRPGSPSASIAAGLALVPEDRRAQGLLLESSISRNVALAVRNRLAVWGILAASKEVEISRTWASRLQLQAQSVDTRSENLSGGNQQKVVLGKWLSTEPKVLIIDEPTRGIDVGTKPEVHRILSSLASTGVAILLISSELPEVLGAADRILVMREGRVAAEISRASATAESILHAATDARR